MRRYGMIKREVIRIIVLALLGLLFALLYINSKNEVTYYSVLLLPVYFIGMFYAGKILLKLMGIVAKTYFSCQFVSLLINPLWGSILCIILLCLGLLAILSFGWLIGWGRCIYCMITAYQLNRQCHTS